MRIKVEEQEMELNASNPRVFMEAQAASKEEVSEESVSVSGIEILCSGFYYTVQSELRLLWFALA